MKANGGIPVAYLKAQNNAIQEWPSANDENIHKHFKVKQLDKDIYKSIRDRRCPTNPEEHCIIG